MDVCDLILTTHAHMLERAHAMVEAPTPNAAKDAYRDLRDALARHARAEGVVIYDSLKHVDDDTTAGLGLKGEIELGVCEDLMAQMARGNADSRAWRAKASVVRALLHRHVQDEREQLMPTLRQQYSAEERQALGKRYEKRHTALMAA